MFSKSLFCWILKLFFQYFAEVSCMWQIKFFNFDGTGKYYLAFRSDFIRRARRARFKKGKERRTELKQGKRRRAFRFCSPPAPSPTTQPHSGFDRTNTFRSGASAPRRRWAEGKHRADHASRRPEPGPELRGLRASMTWNPLRLSPWGVDRVLGNSVHFRLYIFVHIMKNLGCTF